MKRLHLFEFEDQAWFPGVVREGMMDYLRFMISRIGIYDPVVPLLQEALEVSGEAAIVDLCSGGGGGIAAIQRKLSQRMGAPVPVTVTDKYPNLPAFAFLQEQTSGSVRYHPGPVDATRVPPGLKGFRTLFSSFHHFNPPQARGILQDAVNNRVPIGIFEGASKQVHEVLLVLLVFPFVMLAVTPFIRPFKFSRLFFTYLVPLIPLCTIWDGTVSILRLYSPAALLRLAHSLHAPHYAWKAGLARHWSGARVIYLLGYPKK
jgi:hypothetical protein